MNKVRHNEGQWHETLNQLRRRLRTRMDGDTSKAQRERGLEYGINFGVNILHLRELAKSLPPEPDLAEIMWDKEVREMQLLSLMILPKGEMNSETALKLTQEVRTLEVAEQLVHLQLRHLEYAPSLVQELFEERYEPSSVPAVVPYLLMMRTTQREEFTPERFKGISDFILQDLTSVDFAYPLVIFNALQRVALERPDFDLIPLLESVLEQSEKESVAYRMVCQLIEIIEEEQ